MTARTHPRPSSLPPFLPSAQPPVRPSSLPLGSAPRLARLGLAGCRLSVASVDQLNAVRRSRAAPLALARGPSALAQRSSAAPRATGPAARPGLPS